MKLKKNDMNEMFKFVKWNSWGLHDAAFHDPAVDDCEWWGATNGAGADAEILLTKNGNLVQKGLHLHYTDTEWHTDLL